MQELALDVVLLAGVRRTLYHGCVLFCGDRLEDFLTAAIARIGVDLNGRLDIRHSDCDTADCDKVTQVFTTDLAHGHCFAALSIARLGRGDGPEVEGVPAGKGGREEGLVGIEVAGFEGLLHDTICVLSLGEDDIDDIVFEADVGAGLRHELVDGARQDLNVVMCVALNR